MRNLILNTIKDLCSNFLYYDRKEDEELSQEQLYNSILKHEITIDEIVEEFRNNLVNSFKHNLTKLTKLSYNSIKLDMEVYDEDLNCGIVIYCEDPHNIIVEYKNGGQGLFCMVENCADNNFTEDILYILKNN